MGTTADKLAYLKETKNAIKSKLIEKGVAVADTDTFRSYANKLDEISGGGTGGSGAAVVWFVTFIGADGTELYKMPALDGDDCKDPVATGKISAATKESTAQYDYTQSGWSFTDGGDADSTALQAVTEDRTVYAAFTATVRTYTVTYYDIDGATVLNTETLAYGSMPTYEASKEGSTFGGWSPDPVTVTGDASYTVIWIDKVDFATCSWTKIAEYCQQGLAADVFELGATKSVMINGTTRTAEIIGFNHDDLADGSGKAPITLKIVIPQESYYHGANDWGSSFIKKIYFNQWESAYEDGTLDTTKWGGDFPTTWKKVTKQVSSGVTENIIFTIPSLAELGFSGRSDEGECYAAYTSGKSIGSSYTYADIFEQEVKDNMQYTQTGYITRSLTGSSNKFYRIVHKSGYSTAYAESSNANSQMVMLICIG